MTLNDLERRNDRRRASTVAEPLVYLHRRVAVYTAALGVSLVITCVFVGALSHA